MNNEQRGEFWKGLGAVRGGVDDDGYRIARLPCGMIVARDYAGWDWFDPEGVPLEVLLDGLERLEPLAFVRPLISVDSTIDYGVQKPSNNGDELERIEESTNRRTAIIAAICKTLSWWPHYVTEGE